MNMYKEGDFLMIKSSSKVEKKFSVAQYIKKLQRNEEIKFRLMTAFKMSSIPVLSLLLFSSFMYVILNLNISFYKAYGIIQISSFEDVFYDFLSTGILDLIPYFVAFLFFNIVASLYLSEVLLRPFRIIGDYCDKRNKRMEAHYNNDFFSNLKLMGTFCDYFFSYIETAELNGKFHKIVIPNKYKAIHSPAFETAFFLHYFLYILASLLTVSIGFFYLANGIHEGLMSFASQTLASNVEVIDFLSNQKNILLDTFIIVLFITTIFYLLLANHLYRSVASPAFAVFATMRSFMNGNYHQRVHIIGFPAIRNDLKSLNRYLDWVSKNLANEKTTS